MFTLLFIAKNRNKQQRYGSPPEVGEPARPGSFCKQNSLPGLAFTSALRVGLQRHPAGDLGRLPRPPASPSGTASRAGKAFLALAPAGLDSELCSACALRRSKNTLPAREAGREAGLRPQRAFLPPVACGSGLRQKTRRLPHQAAAWAGAGWRPHFTISGRLSAALPACAQRWQSGSPQHEGLAARLNAHRQMARVDSRQP